MRSQQSGELPEMVKTLVEHFKTFSGCLPWALSYKFSKKYLNFTRVELLMYENKFRLIPAISIEVICHGGRLPSFESFQSCCIICYSRHTHIIWLPPNSQLFLAPSWVWKIKIRITVVELGNTSYLVCVNKTAQSIQMYSMWPGL